MLEATKRMNVELGQRGAVKANDSNRDTMISHQILGLMENDVYYMCSTCTGPQNIWAWLSEAATINYSSIHFPSIVVSISYLQGFARVLYL